MQLNEIIDKLQLDVKGGEEGTAAEVTGGYVSDLLSDVIANTKRGDLWITLQIHQNIIAVSTLKELAGVILINDKEPAIETVTKANEEGVPLLTSPKTAFEIICQLYELGISGTR